MGQMASDQADGKERRECDEILALRNRERPDRLEKEEVEATKATNDTMIATVRVATAATTSTTSKNNNATVVVFMSGTIELAALGHPYEILCDERA
jgi:hypothetical protein